MQTDSQTLKRLDVETHAVRRLEMTEFRNHGYTSLDVGGASSVVLHGENGAGKTNILEAISLLAPGRGFRRARLAEMDGQGPWTVFAEVSGAIGDVAIGTAREISAGGDDLSPPRQRGGRECEALEGGVRQAVSFDTHPPLGSFAASPPPPAGGAKDSDRRLVRVDGQPLKSANQLSEYLSVLWLTPQSDQLFSEGGTARRKFLDRLVYGFDAGHAKRMNHYERAMRERNRLLSTYAAQAEWFEAIEAQMAQVGTAIAFARQQCAEHINAVMQMSDLSFPKARLDLDGLIERAVQRGASAREVESVYRDGLAMARPGDCRSGRSSVGIHRAEFSVTHLGKNMEAARCSTGEQKALLLAIILSEARAAALWHHRVPVILLDEVAAHLDPQKRAELYHEIQELKVQAWMSGVSDDLFKEMLGNVAFFRVEKGQIFSA